MLVMLFDLIDNNLSLIDVKSGTRYLLSDILFDLEGLFTGERNLSFLYVSNEVYHVGLYFSFLKSKNSIVLLNELLSESLKHQLEERYKPNLIYDSKRENITNYDKQQIDSKSKSVDLFTAISKTNHNINPKIKLLLSTSGTTGSPKFVKLSENNLIENAKSIIDYLPIKKDDVTPLNLPFYYSYGLSVLHTNAMVGADIVCGVADILQRKFWKELEEYGFTTLSGVPYVYEMLNRIGFRKKQYPSLRYCTQAGGNLNKKTKELFLEYFKENNIDFYVMYGQTEATARISYVHPSQLESHIKSIGIPIKNGVLKIDKKTKELLYKGPNVFGGYSQKPEDLMKWEEIEFLHTGDIAEERNRFYYIIGRLKRFIKLFGNRVNLDELETILKNNYPGYLFANVRLNDKLLLIATNNDSISERQIKEYIYSGFKIHPSVVTVIYLQEFPLTSNGKMDYKKIIDIYESK